MKPQVRTVSSEAIAAAAALLRNGQLVGMPTETVYGLAADATNADAVARVFAAKGRPSFNPLIAHVPDLAAAELHADVPPLARRLAERFWPGPLTLVLRRRAESPIALLACAGLETIALRAPDHPAAQALLAAIKRPLAAPSANPSGRLSPTTASAVVEGLGDSVALVLDAGPCVIGVESTVLAIDGDRAILLRPGGLPRDALEAVAGTLARPDASAAPTSPGMLASHYAPRATLRLDAEAPEPGEAYLGFGARDGDLNLSPTGDLVEAAARLFESLRALDRTAARIAVAPIPETGLGEAINDRLRRAAAPRS